jgi:hypothetical protein
MYNINMNKSTNTILVIIIVIAVGVAGYFAGASIGKQKGIEQTESNLMPIIDMAFPPPPEMLTSTGGTVTGVENGVISLEITDPEDYLPHPDGTPKNKIVRYVEATPETEIIYTDFSSPDPETGLPSEIAIEISEIEEGDRISVRTEENIREQENITATRIEVVSL